MRKSSCSSHSGKDFNSKTTFWNEMDHVAEIHASINQQQISTNPMTEMCPIFMPKLTDLPLCINSKCFPGIKFILHHLSGAKVIIFHQFLEQKKSKKRIYPPPRMLARGHQDDIIPKLNLYLPLLHPGG